MKAETIIYAAVFLLSILLSGAASVAVDETITVQITPIEMPDYIPTGLHGCAPMDYKNCWYVL